MNTIKQRYKTEIIPKVQKELGLDNVMAVPTLSKIVLNIGVKDAIVDKKNVDRAVTILSEIAGQKPKVTKSKKSIASFKLRQGDYIGVMVTLRGKRMMDFFEKLTNIVLPRLRDFRGISKTQFDKQGNYTLGLSEYTVFPEIDPGKVERVQGLQITLVTTAKNNEQGIKLLEELGMPFQKVQS